MRLLLVSLVWTMAVTMPSSFALAGEPDVAEAPISEAPVGAPRTPEEARELAVRVASTLRCPVCQGLSVSASSSKAAIMMYDRIQGQFEEGYSEQQVIDYWVARYGEWVLLAPTGRHWIVWFGPFVVGLGGFAWLSFSLFGGKTPDPDKASSDAALSENDVSQDPYVAQLLSELED